MSLPLGTKAKSPFAHPSRLKLYCQRIMRAEEAHLAESILLHTRKDFPLLHQEQTVQEALDTIRKEGIGEKIIYFYVVDAGRHLVGVLPTRRLLTSPSDKRLAEIMVTRI